MPQEPTRPDQLPARPTEFLPPAAYQDGEDFGSEATPTSKRITAKLVLRAIRRHWWQAALLWFVASIGLMVVAYFKVKPTYLAQAEVEVSPSERGIIRGDLGSSDNFMEYKETQVAILSSPVIAENALAAHPELRNLARLKNSTDPVREIPTLLIVGIRPKTNLIDVSMISEDSFEASQIVNAVIDSYIKSQLEVNTLESTNKVQRYRDGITERAAEIAKKRTEIEQLVAKTGKVDLDAVRQQDTVTIQGYRTLNDELLQVQIKLGVAEAKLTALQNDPVVAPAPVEDPAVAPVGINQRFYNHPRVVAANEDLDKAKEQIQKELRRTTDLADPQLSTPIERKRIALGRLDALWRELEPQLRAEMKQESQPKMAATGPDPAIREAEQTITALKALETMFTERLNKLKIQQKEEGADGIQLEFARMDLGRAESYRSSMESALQQIEFEMRNPIARINLRYHAKPTNRFASNSRMKIVAVAPVAVLFGVLAIMILFELHAGRVVDPEDIPLRVRVPVIGIVPPLPAARSPQGMISARDDFRAQRQLDQFVQSLDHLRVSLCSGRNHLGRERRVILITSAIGSEGKTTLAAQLAERCVNAGLHTLLIDADMRNPTLTRNLDVANTKGLINVLRGEAIADEAMSVVGGGGGFLFMPSGTPRVDPSRLLQGQRLGQFLGQARERFDIVIVDAPPVLPVPDALTIGRWTDGAILAVRYDASRFPLLERANRRLAAVGVPVIGAVVNGVRVTESAYGSYYPSYEYAEDAANPTPIDV